MSDKQRAGLRRPPMQQDTDDFISGAKTETRASESADGYPWQAPHVRQDMIVGFNLRLPEPLKLKLAWVSEQTRKSQQLIVREALEQALNAEIDEIAHKNNE